LGGVQFRFAGWFRLSLRWLGESDSERCVNVWCGFGQHGRRQVESLG
jgi:hypothetical protein